MGKPRTPNPKVIRPIPWEWLEHPQHGRVVRVWSRTFGDWSLQKPWTGLIHEGIDAGKTANQIVQDLRDAGHAKGHHKRNLRRLRMYLFTLYQDGYIDLDFGPTPKRFGTRYTVVRGLGRGGVGVAWLCNDRELDRQVVVKHAWGYFQPLARADALIRGEADVMRRLDHPRLLHLYETFEQDGQCMMVREFVDGMPLLEALQQRSLVLEDIVHGLIDLLEHLHGSGFLLMDLRPPNFFVRAGEDRPVLIDVGVCQPWEGGTIALERTLGSPGFSAPECREQKQASPASDVFGLGRLVFSVLSGRPPVATWSPEQLLSHLEPGPHADMVGRMCAEVPADRPTLQEVRAAFAGAGPVHNQRAEGHE